MRTCARNLAWQCMSVGEGVYADGRLLLWFSLYYLGLSAALLAVFLAWPNMAASLPIGGVTGPQRLNP